MELYKRVEERKSSSGEAGAPSSPPQERHGRGGREIDKAPRARALCLHTAKAPEAFVSSAVAADRSVSALCWASAGDLRRRRRLRCCWRRRCVCRGRRAWAPAVEAAQAHCQSGGLAQAKSRAPRVPRVGRGWTRAAGVPRGRLPARPCPCRECRGRAGNRSAESQAVTGRQGGSRARGRRRLRCWAAADGGAGRAPVPPPSLARRRRQRRAQRRAPSRGSARAAGGSA
mmetsp:Transcript_18400/g.71100  ORF Transcript_18400/g.71100 Transcript_18400/m.71100 type:complete len:229 (+) Transcript_18400:98-784(+)